MASINSHQLREIIGLIPAAGWGTRLSPLPCSKELYPVGFHTLEDGSIRPKVVSHYLLENMRRAGIEKAYFLMRSGKWDTPAYFGDGSLVNMNLGYLIVGLPFGVPYSLDQAYPFVKDAIIALGFPDIIIYPEDSYKRLINRLNSSNADIILGVVPHDQPEKGGVVDFDADGRVHLLIERIVETDLRYSWATAVWTPKFTEFLHQYVAQMEAERLQNNPDNKLAKPPEVPIGDVMQVAINQGMRVEAEVMDDGWYLDVGTPDNLMRAIQEFSKPAI